MSLIITPTIYYYFANSKETDCAVDHGHLTLWSTMAPAFSSTSTMVMWPLSTASASGVHIRLSHALTDAPA